MKVKFILAGLLTASSCVQAEQPAPLAIGLAVDQQFSVVAEYDEVYRGIIGNEGIAFDYIAQRGSFDTEFPLNWYVAGGLWAEWNDDFGLRVPLGLSVDLPHNWVGYAQVQPELDLYQGAELQLGAALGVMYRF